MSTTVPTTVEFEMRKYGHREALAHVHYGDFMIKNFRVMRQTKGDGYWVGMPRKQLKPRPGEEEGEWVDIVWMPDRSRKDAFERFVLDLYEKELRERDATSAA